MSDYLEYELITDGLEFPEGPVALDDGSVLVVELKGRRLTRVTPEGYRETIVELEGSPNGAAIGPDGDVYICNSGGHSWPSRRDGLTLPHGVPPEYSGGWIEKVELDTAKVTRLYTEFQNIPLSGPNDIVFDETGGFWFTDMGRIFGDRIHIGSIYYVDNAGELHRGPSGLITPNGVGLSPDGKTLYTAETLTARVRSFSLRGPGQVEPSVVEAWGYEPLFGSFTDYEVIDSLAVEADGGVCVATVLRGGITTFFDDDEPTFYKLPDAYITNICFGGGDMRDAWFTASATGKLYKTRWPRPGLKLPFNS